MTNDNSLHLPPARGRPVGLSTHVRLRGLGAHTLDLSVLPAERRRFLATVDRRLTGQALARREPERRYPILLAQSATDVRDELAERGHRQALLDDLLAIVADPQISDEQIGGLIRGQRIGWPRIRAALAQAMPRLPRDHGHLAMLDGSYGYLRQFTPHVLAAVAFAGGTAAADLLTAVDILRVPRAA